MCIMSFNVDHSKHSWKKEIPGYKRNLQYAQGLSTVHPMSTSLCALFTILYVMSLFPPISQHVLVTYLVSFFSNSSETCRAFLVIVKVLPFLLSYRGKISINCRAQGNHYNTLPPSERRELGTSVPYAAIR